MTYTTTIQSASTVDKVSTSVETLNNRRAKLLAFARNFSALPAIQQPTVTAQSPTETRVTTETKEPEAMPATTTTREARNQLIGAKFTKSMKEQILEAIAAKGHTNAEGKPDVTSYLTEHFESLLREHYGMKR